ncbi:hypothetical protein ACFLVN_03345 [Chloroflexota bacterium]
MSVNENATILVFDVGSISDVRPSGPLLRSGRIGEKVIKATAVAVDQVEKNMTRFLSGVGDIINRGAEVTGEYEVETVEVNAQISADGQIGFMGSGIGMTGSAGITFVFKRKKS